MQLRSVIAKHAIPEAGPLSCCTGRHPGVYFPRIRQPAGRWWRASTIHAAMASPSGHSGAPILSSNGCLPCMLLRCSTGRLRTGGSFSLAVMCAPFHSRPALVIWVPKVHGTARLSEGEEPDARAMARGQKLETFRVPALLLWSGVSALSPSPALWVA